MSEPAQTTIESVLHEERVFPPPAGFAEQAHIKSFEEYEKLYQESVENPSAAGDPVDEPLAEQITPPEAPPRTEPGPDGSTPCEIAEDQLPQAGQ